MNKNAVNSAYAAFLQTVNTLFRRTRVTTRHEYCVAVRIYADKTF